MLKAYTRYREFLNIERISFPAGETKIQIKQIVPPSVMIELKYQGDQDLWDLGLLVDALRRANPDVVISLDMPYIPYARQDRVCNAGESLSIKVVCDFINNLRLNSVFVLDPHSDVAPALLNNCKIETVDDIIAGIIYKYGVCTLVSPDQGATKKVDSLGAKLSLGVVHCGKTRDRETGALSAPVVYDFFPSKMINYPLLIVDDICDGGGTFLMLAEQLKKNTSRKLWLYVSHGIFSKGLSSLLGQFDRIYVKNNLSGLTDERLISVF